MDNHDLESILGKKVVAAGYDEGEDGYYLMLIMKSKEYYFFSQTEIELEVRDIQ